MPGGVRWGFRMFKRVGGIELGGMEYTWGVGCIIENCLGMEGRGWNVGKGRSGSGG